MQAQSPPEGLSLTADRRIGIYAFDQGWQFPAITEQHACHRMRQIGGAAPGTAYVAYPWATLIDKLQVRSADAQDHLDSFHAFCLSLPDDLVKMTVCQHILMPDFKHLFARAGVSHVFWSHTTRADLATPAEPVAGHDLRLHPFPLYPVQIPQADPERQARTDRRWLYSFVGMRPNDWYLTQVRAWIIDQLGADPRGHVIARDDWHYKHIVYRHQVLGRAAKDAQGRPEPGLVDDAASALFRDVLYDSTFALCPSGSGPNSIRLWEAIMAGSIPVIIADSYAPPGDPRLWEASVVFCDETSQAVSALPDRLAAMARDPARMAALRTGLAGLRLLYGPHGFVPDLATLMQSLAHVPRRSTALTEQAAARVLLACASAALTGRPAPGETAIPDPTPDMVPSLDAHQARAVLPAMHPVRRHYDQVVGVAAQAPAAPLVNRGAGPVLYLAGPGLTPLHYPALRRLAEGRITVTTDLARADLIIAASLRDLQGLKPEPERVPRRAVRLIVSETAMPVGKAETSSGAVWLGHAGSDIFRFDRLPYGLVCDDHTVPRLAGLLAPARDMTPNALRARWAAAPAGAALWWTGGKDAGSLLDPDRTEPEPRGLILAVVEAARARARQGGRGLLCLWPVDIASGPGSGGAANQGPDPAALARAHLDKLVRLDGQAPVIAACEDICHPDHVGVTAIEAVALNARPASVMGSAHRLCEIVPGAALIDLAELAPVDIAEQMLSAPLGLAEAEAVCAARCALRERLSRPRDVLAERQRIVAALLHEILTRA